MKYLITLTLFLTSLNIFSQKEFEDVKIDQGFVNAGGIKKLYVLEIFKVSDGYVMFRKDPIKGPGGWRYYFEKFNLELKSQNVHDVSAQFEKDGFIINDMVKVGQNYILFTKKVESQENKEELFYQIFDFEKTTLGKPEQLYSREVLSRRDKIKYDIVRSTDQELIMVYLSNPSEKDEVKTMDFLVFDENMEKINSFKDFKTNEGHKKDVVIDYALGNLGEIYLLKRDRTGEHNHADFFEYKFITLEDGNSDVQNLAVQDGFIKNISLTVNKDGIVSAAGYYSRTHALSTDGVFVFTGDPKSGIASSVISKEFSTDFITSEFSERQKEKVEKKESKGTDYGMSNLEFRSIVYHEDKSFSIVGEIYWVEINSYTDANGHRHTSRVYHFADYIVARVFEDEEIIFTRYDKHETFGGVAKYFNYNNNLAILETKQKREIFDLDFSIMTRKEIKPYKKDVLGITEIRPNGDQITSILLDNTKPEYEDLKPFQRIGNGSFLFRNLPSNKVELIRSVTYLKDDRTGLMRFSFD